jgi:phosphoribosylanthranilate isomerase
MTRIKMCGLRRLEDIDSVNEILPEYIGFVFFPGSKRHVSYETARTLKSRLDPGIQAVGVFVNELPENVAALLDEGIIDLAQLHGHEDEAYLKRLRRLNGKPVIQAFLIRNSEDVKQAQRSTAEMILLDAGGGDGKTFDWDLLHPITRPYFLAGGLNPENVSIAVERMKPWAVDVSSGIETNGFKDISKMRAFNSAVRDRR